MADATVPSAPTPANSNSPQGGSGVASTSYGNERIPTSSFFGYLFSAIAVDVIFFWLPGAGDVFIAYCRGMYWLNGYKTTGMLAATAIDATIEFIPGLQEFPGCTIFVGWTYAINRSTTKKLTEEEKQEKPKFSFSERAAAFGYAYVNRGAGQQGRGSTSGTQGTAGGASKATGAGASGVAGGLALKAGSYVMKKKVEKAQDREGTERNTRNNVGYQQRGIDGINPPQDASAQNTAYQEAV